MKNISLTISCAFFVIFTIVSCSKPDASQLTNPDSTTLHSLSYKIGSVQNKNNPEDVVGYYHNQVISYFINNGADQSTNISDLIGLTGRYFSNIYDKKTVKNLTTILKKPENIVKLKNHSTITQEALSDSLVIWNTKGKISDAILPYYLKAVNSLDYIDTTNTETGYLPALNDI